MPVTRFTSLGSLKKLGKSHLLGGFIYTPTGLLGCPGSSAIKESACSAKDPGSVPGELFPWRRDRLPTPVFLGFPGGSDGKESTSNVEDLGSIPGSGKSPERGHGNPLQYSCLENSMDRGAWQATVHDTTEEEPRPKRQTQPDPALVSLLTYRKC